MDRIDELRAVFDDGEWREALLDDHEEAELLDIAEALRDALQGLLEWRKQPEVHGEATMAWVHGQRFTVEQTKRLHGYWNRAEAALAKLEVKP